MIPAQSSARRLTRFPKYTPIRQPMMEKMNDTKPMMSTGSRMLRQVSIPVKANEMPTAKASILVATARVRITGKRVGLK